MEILVSQAQERRKKKDSSTIVNEAAWSTFLKRLEANGYFHELLEGSKERKTLELQAKSYFDENLGANFIGRSFEDEKGDRLLKLYHEILSHDVENEGDI